MTGLKLGGEVKNFFFQIAAQNLLPHIRNENQAKKLPWLGWNPPVHGSEGIAVLGPKTLRKFRKKRKS